MGNTPWLRAVLRHNATRSAWIQPLPVVYWPYRVRVRVNPQTPEVPYCYYKLVTNVIRAVNIHVLSYAWYTV